MTRLVSREPFRSISALVRTRIPGVQKPHWRAPEAAKADAKRSLCTGSKPSRVTTSLPATFSRARTQATKARPLTRTVQQPHWPDGAQPSLAEVISSSSRRAESR